MREKTFGGKVLDFYGSLEAPGRLPAGVRTMNPYGDLAVQRNVGSFLKRFFSDSRPRIFIFGINPGRFGAGVTGVTFTDPAALERFCGIPNDLPKKRELSSIFVYDVIQRWGGPRKFYKDFFLTAVSPLGFLQNGVNHNYYDDPRVFVALKPFIVQTLNSQLSCGARRSAAILLGTGKNWKFFNDINQEHGFFKKVYALEHPRFIMQYRRKRLPRYLQRYSEVFRKALDGGNGL